MALVSNPIDSSAVWTITATPKAGRAQRVDQSGVVTQQRASYRACSTAKYTGTYNTAGIPLVYIVGSEAVITRITRVRLFATVATTAIYGDLAAVFDFFNTQTLTYNAAWPAIVSFDTTNPIPKTTVLFGTTGLPLNAASALRVTYGSLQQYVPLTGTIARNPAVFDFDWRFKNEAKIPRLNSSHHIFAITAATALGANALTLTAQVDFTEEAA